MSSLFAQISSPETTETVFRWARIQENRDWFLPVLVVVLLVVYFYRRYRIDAVDLKAWQRGLLLVLRTAALVALLFFYLNPQWEHFVANSRVAVVIDTSASMGNRDLNGPEGDTPDLLDWDNPDAPLPTAAATPSGPSRLEGVLDWMDRSELVDRLLEKHDVVVYSFDKSLHRLQTRRRETGLSEADAPVPEPEKEPAGAENDETTPEAPQLATLKADGEETCLGEALFEVLQRERGQPLAGVVLVTDGRQNAGRSLEAPLETAERLKIPVYPIGVGPTRQPLNFRIGNASVPDRAFHGDPFKVRVPVEMLGGETSEAPQTWTVPVQLWLQPDGEGPETKIDEKELKFAESGVIETEFNVRIAELGRKRIIIKLAAPREDRNEADNSYQADVEVIDRKDRVLMFASAPSRDYQFLSTQVFRDKSMSVDVYLPWARPGISQNADKILDHFPSTQAEMAEYDVVVAFDPSWSDLSSEQIDVLEHWIARQGGGLLLFAGAVKQGDTITGWVTDPNMEKIRALYPVDFLARQSSFEHRYHGGSQAWPLKFTRAGEDAEFLRPFDDPVEARSFWSEFPGFFGYFAVRSVKPTATLLVASGSPETLGRDESGALFVEQFYGAGRVLYVGSSELWRLRRGDERSYEQLATKILKHVAQGRLQRESDRGSLATDKPRYTLGSIAQLRVTANDAQLQPLSTPTLPLDVLTPAGTLRTVDLAIDPNVPGTYATHLPLNEEGSWSMQFSIPDSDQKITRTVLVQMSDLERENPSRNEPLLREIALKSGGVYYDSPSKAQPMVKDSPLYGSLDFFARPRGAETEENAVSDAAEDDETLKPVVELLRVRSQRAVLDTGAQENSLRLFLMLICGFLMLEWTLRRLMKLA